MNQINHFDNHFEQNRPVHLARRDVYFEKAAELISNELHGQECGLKNERYEEILFMLRTARQHARFSIRNSGKNEHDEQFSLFINLLAGNVKAVLSMINLRKMVENSNGSSFSFLGVNQASAGLQAEEYQRRAEDIVRSMQNTLKLAEEPFEQLKARNRSIASGEANERYEKARAHFSELVKEKPSTYRVPSLIRKFMRF
ncbi:MAG: hypothetical protein GXY61_10855 [Lentisphaerae bacterium]|nr:hypothetical protein [Lentisphaerota bacterium]